MSQNNHQQSDKAGMIATFYGPRDKIEPLTHELGVALGLVIQAFPDMQYLSAPDEGQFLRYFDPPAAHDTRVVLLALSEAGEAHLAWEKLVQKLTSEVKLNAILDRFAAQKALWGYNLIYHAVLVAGGTANEETLGKLLPLGRRAGLPPSKRAEWLAHTNVIGTDLWLLDIPAGNGSQAATVYVALAPLEKEQDMITKVLYGPGAMLLMPDLIAHKSYYQIRQLTPPRRHQYEAQLAGLRDHIAPLLGLTRLNPSQTEPHPAPDLDTLSKTYARLLLVTSFLDDLRVALAQQLENYTWWEEELGEGNLAQYYKRQIRTTYRELELLIEKGQRMLDATRTTIEMVQAKLEQRREQRESQIAALIAILGVALAVSQLIDPEAAKALLILCKIPLSSDNRLVQLLVQLLITAFLTGLIYWLYHKWRKKGVFPT